MPQPQPLPVSFRLTQPQRTPKRHRPPLWRNLFQGGIVNGRNRSRRTTRQATPSTTQPPRFRQIRSRYDRQRHATGYRKTWDTLPWQVMHRYNVHCLSVGGCY